MDSSKKQTIRAYCDAVGRGDGEAIRRLVTEDYTHEFIGSTSLRGKRNLSEVVELVQAFSSSLTQPGKFEFQEMVEEGDQVAAFFTGKCELANGRRFDGDYAVICRFRGDKMLSLRELIDTKLADSVMA